MVAACEVRASSAFCRAADALLCRSFKDARASCLSFNTHLERLSKVEPHLKFRLVLFDRSSLVQLAFLKLLLVFRFSRIAILESLQCFSGRVDRRQSRCGFLLQRNAFTGRDVDLSLFRVDFGRPWLQFSLFDFDLIIEDLGLVYQRS